MIFACNFVNAEIITEEISEMYTNSNGVLMSIDQREKLNLIYGDNFAEIIDLNTFEMLSSRLSGEILDVEEIYIKTQTRYSTTGEVIQQVQEEITEAEYHQIGSLDSISPMVVCEDDAAAACWETTGKKITLAFQIGANGKYYAIATTNWKNMPKVRSNDLSALRFATELTVDNTFSNPYAYMMYTKSGSDDITVEYANTVKSWNDNGNHVWIYPHDLPSGSLSMLKIVQEVAFVPNVYTPQVVRATYQHAVSSISESTALGCVQRIDSSGVGGMFYMNNTCKGYFDQMQGLNTTFRR